MGYTVDGDGIRPDVNRVAALQNAPRPTSIKALQSFLGFTQYYSKFVRNFSLVAQPLFDLATLGEPFEWTTEAEKSYNDLLNAILRGPVLRSFQTNKRSEVVVDASETTIGAVLEQESHPVVCISRRLSKAEVNYSQTQREALAIVWAVRRLHKYLFGSTFLLVTDHKALKYIFQPESSLAKTTTAMLQRWAIELSAYSYEIQHRSGKNIPQADSLSLRVRGGTYSGGPGRRYSPHQPSSNFAEPSHPGDKARLRASHRWPSERLVAVGAKEVSGAACDSRGPDSAGGRSSPGS